MTDAERERYKKALISAGFDEEGAERAIDDAEQEIAYEHKLEVWKKMLDPARPDPPEAPAPRVKKPKEDRAARVISRQILQQGSSTGSNPAPQGSFLATFEASFRQGLRELGFFSQEEIDYIVGPDA